VQNIYHGNWRVWVLKLVLRYPVRPSDPHWPVARAEKQDIKVTDNGAKHGAVDEPTQSERSSCVIKPGPHQQQCRSNVRLCCQKRQQCRTSFALKFRPFDKVERCFDIVASVDRALGLVTGGRGRLSSVGVVCNAAHMQRNSPGGSTR